jgi:hypothetical protein
MGVVYREGASGDVSQAKLSGAMNATVVNGAPCTRRQNPQWQFATGPNGPVK